MGLAALQEAIKIFQPLDKIACYDYIERASQVEVLRISSNYVKTQRLKDFHSCFVSVQTNNALGHSRHCLVHPVSALVILSIVSNAANVEHILAFAILHREGNFVVIKSHVVINVARTSI